MNFLAHALLSGTNEKILAGNFFGDFVKGTKMEDFDSDIQKGVWLHREIDQFTDNHEIVYKTKKRLRKKFRHYAPVIADVFYDHFLAHNWEHFHHQTLLEFTDRLYKRLSPYVEIFPNKAQHMFQYMRRDNWLYHYQYLDGIDKALAGMSRRTKFDSKMEYSTQELKENYTAYEEDFQHYFPILKAHIEVYLSKT